MTVSTVSDSAIDTGLTASQKAAHKRDAKAMAPIYAIEASEREATVSVPASNRTPRVKCAGSARRVHSGLCRRCGRTFPKGQHSIVLPTHYVTASAQS